MQSNIIVEIEELEYLGWKEIRPCPWRVRHPFKPCSSPETMEK